MRPVHCGGQNATGGEDTGARGKVPRVMLWRRQPNTGVIRQDITKLDDMYDSFTINLSTLATVLGKAEAEDLEEHFLVWARHIVANCQGLVNINNLWHAIFNLELKVQGI